MVTGPKFVRAVVKFLGRVNSAVRAAAVVIADSGGAARLRVADANVTRDNGPRRQNSCSGGRRRVVRASHTAGGRALLVRHPAPPTHRSRCTHHRPSSGRNADRFQFPERRLRWRLSVPPVCGPSLPLSAFRSFAVGHRHRSCTFASPRPRPCLVAVSLSGRKTARARSPAHASPGVSRRDFSRYSIDELRIFFACLHSL